MKTDIVIIGAGLTGLTTGFHLSKKGKDVLFVERNNRIGGQIQTYKEEGFTFESGPNTGVISYPEVAELFQELGDSCQLDIAHDEAKCRLIWKGEKFHALPNGLFSAVRTPLFSFADKFRILGEPFRAKGDNPDESVGELARRRLGKSFLDYAVDPFLSGVYAGDPMNLTTRYALPKLYNLEQQYGSFIKGSIAKAKMPKTDRDRLATKKVFSAVGGLERLTDAMTDRIGRNRFFLSAHQTQVNPLPDGRWKVSFFYGEENLEIEANRVITTVGAYALPELLPFIQVAEMDKISNLYYAPVVQVSIGVKDTGALRFNAFGGLIPSKEEKDILGILYPSACFDKRAPENGALFSCFIGGVRHPEMVNKTNEELIVLVEKAFHEMLKFPENKHPDLIRIFRHQQAIPQYRSDSGARFETIASLEKQYPGLVIAGNLRGGIGMADRIRQGTAVSKVCCKC